MSYYADEHYAVYHEVRVFASKQHDCDAVLCSEPIRKGDPYWRISIVYDGRAETVKRCVRCQAIHLHLRDLGDDTWPDERLACGQDYAEEWGGPPPAEIAALAFWKAGEALPADTRCVYTDPGRMPTLRCYDWRNPYWREQQPAQWHTCGRTTAPHGNPCNGGDAMS